MKTIFDGVDHHQFGNDGNPLPKLDITGMLVPVQCNHCGKAYDLTEGKPVHRYADCTVYITPCCSRQVDDRTWVSLPAFRKIDRKEGRARNENEEE